MKVKLVVAGELRVGMWIQGDNTRAWYRLVRVLLGTQQVTAVWVKSSEVYREALWANDLVLVGVEDEA